MKYKGISAVELLLVILVVLFVLWFIFPAINRPRSISPRLMCATNLKGLGMAMMIYSYDYDEEYPMIGDSKDVWSDKLGFNYDTGIEAVNSVLAKEKCPVTLTANWYLLIKYADVTTKQLICPSTDMIYFEYEKNDKSIEDLWDFGPNPFKHCSYVTFNRYTKYKPTAEDKAGLVIAADISPFFDTEGTGQIIQQEQTEPGNSLAHKNKGQNVLFNDGHVVFEKTPTVGIDDDNIYTYWSGDGSQPEHKQIGQNPTSRDTVNPKQNQPQDANDTFLVL